MQFSIVCGHHSGSSISYHSHLYPLFNQLELPVIQCGPQHTLKDINATSLTYNDKSSKYGDHVTHADLIQQISNFVTLFQMKHVRKACPRGVETQNYS